MNEAVDIAAGCVDAMYKLTGVKLQQKKLDFVDAYYYIDGSVGHLGLSISSDLAMRANTTKKDVMYSARTICHTVAEQYFGNMVTIKDWGNFFLHYSLSEFFTTEALRIMPQFSKIMFYKEFIDHKTNIKYVAKHPILDTYSHEDQVIELFAPAFINQIRYVVGDKTFFKAIQKYLLKFASKNADYNDFLDVFEEVLENKPLCGSLTFKEFALTWLKNIGTPKLKISKSSRGYSFNILPDASNKNQKWNIPMFVYDIKAKKENIVWLLDNGELCLPMGFNLSLTANYMFNHEGKGAYYQIYDFPLWVKLWTSDNMRAMPVKNIYTILDNEWEIGSFMNKKSANILIDRIANALTNTSDLLFIYDYAIHKGLHKVCISFISLFSLNHYYNLKFFRNHLCLSKKFTIRLIFLI